MESIWSRTVQIPEREALSEDRQAEVAVIGAGMAGLLIAHYLQKQGREVIVIDGGRIAGGQTRNTTAKITSQHGLVYASMLAQFGKDKAGLYAGANEWAIAEFERLIREEQIQCHFERVNSYLYSRKEQGRELEREAEAARSLGIQAHFVSDTQLPFPVQGAVCFENQAQFHPLEFAAQLAERLTIYENTEALRVKGSCIETEHGKIYADQIVFATHYPFPNVPGFYFLRQHQERSYVIAISGIPKFEGMYYSEDADGLSFRWYGDILLVGGGGHRTGEKAAECGYTALDRQVKALYPKHEQVACWAAQDCVPHDSLPLIGRFSCLHSNWYVATGMKKWGMTGSMVAAGIIGDMICGKENSYERLFSPQRFHFMAAREMLWKDIKVSAAGLVRGHFRRGALKCPHLGCELKWNEEEKTWDCPCHGSRFDEEGRLLDNPAQVSIEAGVTCCRQSKH